MAQYIGTIYNVLGNVIPNDHFAYKFYAEITYTQNVTNNTTTFTIKPYVYDSHGFNGTWYFKLDGSTYLTKTASTHGTNPDTVDGGTATKTVTHNADGTKTVTLNIGFETSHTKGANNNLNTYTVKSGTISATITLPTIPRASSFSFSGDLTMAQEKKFKISSASSSFAHTFHYSFGSVSGDITVNGDSASWTPSRDLGHQIPYSTGGVGTFTLKTYSGGTHIGTTTQTFTLWVAGDMYPSFSSLQLTGNNLSNDSYVQTISSVTATIIGETTSYGSPIASHTITGHGLNVSAVTGTSSVLNTSGNITYTAKITDGRGRSATKTATIYVVPYQKPTISIRELYRCDTNGNPQNEGSNVKIVADYSFSDPNGQLTKRYDIKYRTTEYEAEWTNIAVENAPVTVAKGTIEYILNAISVVQSYDIGIVVKDNYGESMAIGGVGVASCLFNIEEDGIGIGKYHQQGTLDVGGSMYVDGSLKMTNLSSTANFGMSITLRNFEQSTYDTQISCTEDYPFNVWTANANVPSELSITDNGRLLFNGTDLYTRTVSFTPYLFSNAQTSANWTQTSAVGRATYFGDLVFAQGRVIATHDGTPNSNAEVAIGGLPESNIWNYPPVNLGWVSGLTTNLNSQTYAIRGYVQAQASHIRLCFDYRTNNSWQFLKSTHIRNGEIDVCFSVLYRWR